MASAVKIIIGPSLGFFSKTFACISVRCLGGVPYVAVQEAARRLEECRSVLVMAGAGLSTASGIPDFRSPGTGLYYNLQQYNLPYPEAIFDLGYFAQNPQPFLTLAREIYPGEKYRPNLGHFFALLLHKKEKLLRMYTQNIDGLERLAGIPADKLVEAHGSFSTASCIKCCCRHDAGTTRAAILKGDVVHCTRCDGLVKPDIVFFGETLPDRFFMYQEDSLYTDFLLVIGTSLEVYPFAAIADNVGYNVPRLLLNREVVGSLGTRAHDSVFVGDIVQNVRDLADALGWLAELEELQQKSTAVS